MAAADRPSVASLAEEPVAHVVDPLPPAERVVTERYCVNLGAVSAHTIVQRVRCREDELGAVIAEVRALVADRGHSRAIWFVGPSSRPSNLLALLRQAGFVPTTTPPWEPRYAAMVMTRPPAPPIDPTISARRVESLEEVVIGLRIDAAATGVPDAELDAMLHAAPALYEAERRDGQLTFLAFDGTGKAIAVATAVVSPLGLELAAAATLPDHRGRGAYRALVQARWSSRASRHAGPGRLGRRDLEADPGTPRLPDSRHSACSHRPSDGRPHHRCRPQQSVDRIDASRRTFGWRRAARQNALVVRQVRRRMRRVALVVRWWAFHGS